MSRLAWFGPWPATPPGLPDTQTLLVDRLRRRHTIDRFVDVGDAGSGYAADEREGVHSAHDFVWKQALKPYDLTVFDLADSSRHSFVWPYLVRYPGLVVLHDDHLHRSRAEMLRRQGRSDAYWAEFRYNHPHAQPDVPEAGLAGLLGHASGLWSMRRVIVESSRLLVVPNAWTAASIREHSPHDRIAVIEPGAPRPRPEDETRGPSRKRFGFTDEDVVFATFGPLTRSRRVDRLLATMALLKDDTPVVRLLLCGESSSGYPCRSEVDRLGIGRHVVMVEHVDGSTPFHCLAAADVSVCLQWPPGPEALWSWVSSLAAGTPSIVTDRADAVDCPTLDPRDWQVPPTAPANDDTSVAAVPAEPASVSLDPLDEEHSLQLAMHRLAGDPALRARIGRGARQLWRDRFQLDREVDDFEAAIDKACATPPSAVDQAELPAHLLDDGNQGTLALLEPFGAEVCRRAGLASADGPEVPSEP